MTKPASARSLTRSGEDAAAEERCLAAATFGALASVRCELSAGHAGICGGHDGPIWWVWGTPDPGETIPEEP